MKRNKRNSFRNKNQLREDRYSQTDPLLREGQFQELEQGSSEINLERAHEQSEEKSDDYSDTHRIPFHKNRHESGTLPQKASRNLAKNYVEESEDAGDQENKPRKFKPKRRKAA